MTILLALTSASRVLAIKNLSVKYMTRSKNQYIFLFDKLLKNWRNGQCSLVIYDVFPQDSTLCVVTINVLKYQALLEKIRIHLNF